MTAEFFDVAMQKLSAEFPRCLCFHQDMEMHLLNQDNGAIVETRKCRVVLIQDISQNYQHAAVISQSVGHEFVEYPQLLENFIRKNSQDFSVQVSNAFISRHSNSNSDLVFTRSVYLCTSMIEISEEDIIQKFKQAGMNLVLRDDRYWEEYMSSKIPDVFICHDSRDKEIFVDPLVSALSRKLIKVWYDKLSLRIGDSLTEKIDTGLSQCKFGVVIISKNFLSRQPWTAREFRSLTTREIHTGNKVILPIWLDVTRDDVANYSLELADKFALDSKEGIDSIAAKIYAETLTTTL